MSRIYLNQKTGVGLFKCSLEDTPYVITVRERPIMYLDSFRDAYIEYNNAIVKEQEVM